MSCISPFSCAQPSDIFAVSLSFFFLFCSSSCFVSFQVGAYLYIFGGVNDETGFEGKNDLLRMSVRPDPTTSKFAWEIVQHGNNNGGGPTARKGHVAALLSSRFFVIFSGALVVCSASFDGG